MQHNRYNRKRRQQRKRRFWQSMQALSFAVFFFVLTLIGVRLYRTGMRSAEEHAAGKTLEQLSPAPESSAAQDEDSPPQIIPETQELLEQNADLVGMVGFGDMTLYVCQSGNNYYYASHRFDGSEDAAGMIYMDYRCSILPASDNIVLYGHNMQDGSRFGKLKRYESVDYFLENPTVRFASLYEVNDYSPIAVFYASADESAAEYFDFARIHFADEADFDRYVSAVKAKSLYYIPTAAQYGDQLLTLATCSSELERGRLVVVCRKAE